MHRERVVTFDEVRLVAVPGQQRLQFFIRDPSQNGRICDLVAVEVQHWQDGAIADGIQEFVRMPRGCKWTGFRLAVTDYDGDDQIRIVEYCSVRMRDGVPKFAAFVDRTGRLRGAVRANSSRKGELSEELEHARFVAALVRINLGVVAFEIAVGERGWRTMTRAGDVDDIQVVLLDDWPGSEPQ
jgi:hypothetical protein